LRGLVDIGAPATPAAMNGPPGAGVAAIDNASTWLALHAAVYRLPDGSGPPLVLFAQPAELRTMWNKDDWDSVRQYLASLAPYYNCLQDAAQQPIRFSPDFTMGPSMPVGPQYETLLDASTWVVRRVEYAPDDDNITAITIECAALLLDLADRCEYPTQMGYALVNGLRRSALDCLKTASKCAHFIARQARESLEGRLVRLGEATGPPVRPVHGEVAFGLWLLDARERGKGEGWFSAWTQKPLVYRDGALFATRMREVLGACGASPEAAMLHVADFDKWPNETSRLCPVSFEFSIVPSRYFRDFAEGAAMARLARVSLAVMTARDARGEWPARLSDIAPFFSDGIPLPPAGQWTYVRTRAAISVSADAAMRQPDLVWIWDLQ